MVVEGDDQLLDPRHQVVLTEVCQHLAVELVLLSQQLLAVSIRVAGVEPRQHLIEVFLTAQALEVLGQLARQAHPILVHGDLLPGRKLQAVEVGDDSVNV